MKIPMTHGEIRFGELPSDGQAKVFGATTAAWYGFGATDHDRAGRPCA